MTTTGQAIRVALNDRIAELNNRIAERVGAVEVDVERVDELTEFRVTVNRILVEADELGPSAL